MILKGNVILITGGTSGLELEMEKRFIGLENQVIVCSRNFKKLEETKKLLPSVEIYQCDISHEADRIQLYNHIMKIIVQQQEIYCHRVIALRIRKDCKLLKD